jgi:hypothetical protein
LADGWPSDNPSWRRMANTDFRTSASRNFTTRMNKCYVSGSISQKVQVQTVPVPQHYKSGFYLYLRDLK